MKIINVEVRVISQAEGKDDNSYRDIDNFAHQKQTESNNCFIIDFKPKITNMARKETKNKPRRPNMQITELSVSQ